MVSLGVIEKTENGYRTIARITRNMRMRGNLPFSYLADNTRWVRKAQAYTGIVGFLDEVQALYRRDFLNESEVYIEIWSEKDAIASLLAEVAYRYDVPVMVNRGYSSITFLFNAARTIESIGKPTFIYYFGDSDPSGKDIERDTASKLKAFAPRAEIHFIRAAVTDSQIEKWRLPTRPGKATDSRAKKYGGPIVEVDAIPSDMLKALVEELVASHIDEYKFYRLRETEEMERSLIESYFQQIKNFERESA